MLLSHGERLQQRAGERLLHREQGGVLHRDGAAVLHHHGGTHGDDLQGRVLHRTGTGRGKMKKNYEIYFNTKCFFLKL